MVFDLDRKLMHVHIGRILQIRRIHERKRDGFLSVFDRGSAHARLVIERAIMRQHELVAVAVVHGCHRGAVGRGQDFGEGRAAGAEGEGDLVGLAIRIRPLPFADQEFERREARIRDVGGLSHEWGEEEGEATESAMNSTRYANPPLNSEECRTAFSQACLQG